MPAFIKTKEDERLWQKAKKITDKKELEGRSYWAYVNSIYQRMHKSVKESADPSINIEDGYMTDFKTWWDKHPDSLLTRIPKNKYDTRILKKKPGDKKGSPISVWGAPSSYDYVAN
jgi:hypothetical protein